MATLRSELEGLGPGDRRSLALQWADRAVRVHAAAALEEVGYCGLGRGLRELPELCAQRTARAAVVRCVTTGAGVFLKVAIRLLVSPAAAASTLRTSTRSLLTLLHAAQAALVASGVHDVADALLVSERAIGAARTAPRLQVEGQRGSRSHAMSAAVDVEEAAGDELRHQLQEARFAKQLNGGGAYWLADRPETLGELASKGRRGLLGRLRRRMSRPSASLPTSSSLIGR